MEMKNVQKRNARYNQNGTIDCEIEHPEWGWIPFTASPDDCEAHGREIYKELTEGEYGKIEAYIPPSKEEVEAKLKEESDQKRKQAYVDEVLPLFLEAQAGLRLEKDWQDKMIEISAKYSEKEAPKEKDPEEDPISKG